MHHPAQCSRVSEGRALQQNQSVLQGRLEASESELAAIQELHTASVDALASSKEQENLLQGQLTAASAEIAALSTQKADAAQAIAQSCTDLDVLRGALIQILSTA